MKNNITITILSLFTTFFIGCGGGSNNTNQDNTLSDIILKKNETVTCKNNSQFSVIPTDKPNVQFTKDINNGEVTITLTKSSQGLVTITNCTKK